MTLTTLLLGLAIAAAAALSIVANNDPPGPRRFRLVVSFLMLAVAGSMPIIGIADLTIAQNELNRQLVGEEYLHLLGYGKVGEGLWVAFIAAIAALVNPRMLFSRCFIVRRLELE